MAWIKMRHDLPDDPAVIAMASILDLPEDCIIGKLLRFWSWADTQTVDGNASGVTTAWLDRYVGVTGFSKAMVEVGWLDTSNGGLTIPKFDNHISQSAKQRAVTARRVAKHRSENTPKCNESTVTKKLPEKSKRREESLDSSKEESSPGNLTVHPADNLRSFPLIQGVWKLPQKKYDEYEAAYGDKFDFVFELNKARQWLLDHKDRRPKAKMAGFLTRWMNNVRDFQPRARPGSSVADDLDGEGVYNPETGEIVKPMGAK